MSVLPLKGQKGQTHSKFIVWILLSFPERPGVPELLHFIGSVVAAEGHSKAVFSLLEKPLPDLISTKPVTYLPGLSVPH